VHARFHSDRLLTDLNEVQGQIRVLSSSSPVSEEITSISIPCEPSGIILTQIDSTRDDEDIRNSPSDVDKLGSQFPHPLDPIIQVLQTLSGPGWEVLERP
jgi:hypothetical protein